jgi:hypothetical protein
MATTYSVFEEEMISQNFQDVLKTLKVYHLFSNRIGLELTMQNGRICASNLNFYKTQPDILGNVNCVVKPLTEEDRDRIKKRLFDILKILSVRLPFDMIGQIEIIADFDAVHKMRIRHVQLNLRSCFQLNSEYFIQDKRSDPPN